MQIIVTCRDLRDLGGTSHNAIRKCNVAAIVAAIETVECATIGISVVNVTTVLHPDALLNLEAPVGVGKLHHKNPKNPLTGNLFIHIVLFYWQFEIWSLSYVLECK